MVLLSAVLDVVPHAASVSYNTGVSYYNTSVSDTIGLGLFKARDLTLGQSAQVVALLEGAIPFDDPLERGQ